MRIPVVVVVGAILAAGDASHNLGPSFVPSYTVRRTIELTLFSN
jgi:hypothetical protein